MGKSPSFCFNIKACAGNADDGDFSTLPEVKTSPEKRRWSFRKKYARHHVPSNTVISEPLPIFNENQYQEATAVTFYSEKDQSDAAKASVAEQKSPTLQLPSAVVSAREPKEFTTTSSFLVDKNIPEHAVLVIQTSIRRRLAQNELQKLKYAVKLQAAARGYLVRRQAAGTLRCIQALVKMQALVRARRYVQLVELTEKENLDEYIPADAVKQTNVKLNKTPSAIRKLVSSAFARQLLESTPKAKSIRISCDPLRPDSAWNWLERWMALASMDQEKLILNQDDLKKNLKNDLPAYDVDVRLHDNLHHASSDSDLAGNSPKVPEVEGDLVTSSKCAELSDLTCVSDHFLPSPVPDNELQSHAQESVSMENEGWSKKETKEVSEYISSQMQQPSDANLHLELDGNPSKQDHTEDNFKNGARNELSDADEDEGGKALNGSRKSKNPAFAAVQAKFEELSSPNSNRHFDYSSSDVIVSESAHSQVDFTSNEVNEITSVYSNVVNEVNLNEKLSSHSPKGQGTASAYGAEISVSSLHTPEDSLAESIPELRTSDEINHRVESVTNGSLKFDETEAETENNISNLVAVQQERKEESSKNAAISVSPVEAVQMEEDAENKKPLPYGSPRNHTFVEDSPATSSNQMPLHIRTAKAEDNIPARKKKPQSALKNSPTHLTNDSDARSSGEHLSKAKKRVKRPNSSGSDKSNHVDHEDRSSCNSLPSYMQLTESAKAKINTSFSQKSSVGHHKDNVVKKRHSFPIGNEKQGLSPRMRSPKSQTSQDLKGNGVSSDNSTERRWQI